ncbi:MarR family winged helix-turn-helix transcriptional regulator [Streptomyces griseus]|uniref:HTH marR-type domain-containing protein n=1 Tax=Streptomyces sp. CMC78 TaxID=3231512 RepID=A0AB33KJN5_9ACTN|nr:MULTISPECIES: MarR family transcriptional regulator [unclassified Streptomyces]MDX5577518.1 MarR family transcriptional regulator [Streptomyces sp. ID01-9D]WSV22341.1 MarR family transcriptional regulator [Streptomyces fimicarius]WTC88765.1 MarR family transcriptional regulator [Streptomyces griseus]WTD68611.1 MarR family transcriptional regulator [Streptomyces griseus]
MANNPLSGRWLSLVRVGALMNQRIEHALSEKYDLCVSAYEIMEVLSHEAEWIRPGEVSTRTSRSQPQVSRLVTQMVDAGYVAREPSPGDGRSSQIRLTDSGHRIFAEAAATVEDVLGRIAEENADARALIS